MWSELGEDPGQGWVGAETVVASGSRGVAGWDELGRRLAGWVAAAHTV